LQLDATARAAKREAARVEWGKATCGCRAAAAAAREAVAAAGRRGRRCMWSGAACEFARESRLHAAGYARPAEPAACWARLSDGLPAGLGGRAGDSCAVGATSGAESERQESHPQPGAAPPATPPRERLQAR